MEIRGDWMATIHKDEAEVLRKLVKIDSETLKLLGELFGVVKEVSSKLKVLQLIVIFLFSYWAINFLEQILKKYLPYVFGYFKLVADLYNTSAPEDKLNLIFTVPFTVIITFIVTKLLPIFLRKIYKKD